MNCLLDNILSGRYTKGNIILEIVIGPARPSNYNITYV